MAAIFVANGGNADIAFCGAKVSNVSQDPDATFLLTSR
jgi:hypothetical protein